MDTANKVYLLGKNSITIALGKLINLFGVDSNKANSNFLILVDADDYDLKGFLKKEIPPDSQLLFFYFRNGNIHSTHPLCFLQAFFPTFKIPIEDFSIADLIKILFDLPFTGEEKLVYRPPCYDPLLISNRETLRALRKDYPCLDHFAKKKVNGFLHALKTNFLTIKDDLEKLSKDFSEEKYKKFLVSFNHPSTWQKGRKNFKECIEEIGLRGFSEEDFPEMESLSRNFDSLGIFRLPKSHPKGYIEPIKLKEKLEPIKTLIEEIDQICRKGTI